jgi:hypothetical protein
MPPRGGGGGGGMDSAGRLHRFEQSSQQAKP